MATVLFIVHGMGVHGADWAAGVTEKLDEVAKRYEHFGPSMPFTEQVDVVPVTYDHVFASELERWRGAADDLRRYTLEHGIRLGGGATLFDWLAAAGETEANVFWSQVVDVLLYRFVSDVGRQVRLHVMRRVAAALEERMRGGQIVHASVLAHGLGTAVVHDALALLGARPLDGSEAFLAGQGFRFDSLFALANVSRALQTHPAVYESVVRPLAPGVQDAYFAYYFDVRHAFDPVPNLQPFAPAGWGRRYIAMHDLAHFRAFNVHAFEHYLDHPRVHIPLLNAVLGGVVAAEEREAAVAGYADIEGIPCADELLAFKGRVEQMIALLRGEEAPERLAVAATQFFAAAKEAHDACF